MNLFVETLLFLLQLIAIFFKRLLRWIIPKKYKSVKGEVCLVTGAGNGIGRLMALDFARRGAIMILWDINEKGNHETAEMIKADGGSAYADVCDISSREEVYKAAQRARDVVTGDITILVNNAGIVYGKNFLEMKDEEIEKTMKVNSFAHFWTVKAFLPSMLENNHGHIVTVGSVLGLFASPGLPIYVASKHAAVGFNNALSLDLHKYGKSGVKTTVICPYHMTTGMFTGLRVRFPSLLPSLKPEETVQVIMHGILTEQNMVAIPRSMYLSYNMVTWLPHEAYILLQDFIGAFQTMDYFKPTREYQKQAAGKNNNDME